MKCERCRKETLGTIMSKFNTEIICGDCKDAETEHPAYAAADRAEVEAVRRGDNNFPGVGLPADLRITN